MLDNDRATDLCGGGEAAHRSALASMAGGPCACPGPVLRQDTPALALALFPGVPQLQAGPTLACVRACACTRASKVSVENRKRQTRVKRRPHKDYIIC